MTSEPTPAEVFEVASFYHHFDIVKEGDAIPAPITVRVCESIQLAQIAAKLGVAAGDGFRYASDLL